jgi:hypothetical protein
MFHDFFFFLQLKSNSLRFKYDTVKATEYNENFFEDQPHPMFRILMDTVSETSEFYSVLILLFILEDFIAL